MKRLGTNGFTAKSTKHEWTETALAVREETVTIASGATTLTVNDAYQYQVYELIKIEDEVLQVSAIASATTLTVTRGAAGTTDATHTSKTAISLGTADPENAQAQAAVADNGARLYNYVQTFTRGVELSNDEIAQLSTAGNPMTGQVARRFIEINRQLAKAVLYGVRYENSSTKTRYMGGLTQFVTTNVTDVSGAVTVAAIDAKILAIVEAGGDPKLLAMSPRQKQKLDALDANLVRIGKKDPQSKVGGNPNTMTWQSGILSHDLDMIVDQSIAKDELWILDTEHLAIGHYSNNGVQGSFHTEDATTPGQDGQHKVIRGKYTLRVGQEKAHARLYGLTT
ncbi:DUF5309 family protein [uncultured Kiloniella sp.]|uniref:SU10 major capsid protein n=1 Tax=uncultured Kiloniella sp. TaxID=1133091 RepID=UPI002638620A|nr:DUF5309 family protein [uncultured Kiloniella sp.]